MYIISYRKNSMDAERNQFHVWYNNNRQWSGRTVCNNMYKKRANLNVAVAEKEYEGTGQIAESGNVNNYLGLPNISGWPGRKIQGACSVSWCRIYRKRSSADRSSAKPTVRKEESAIYRVKFDDDTIAEARALIYTAGAYPRKAEFAGKGWVYRKGSILLRNLWRSIL